jgi:hypothetical protein
MILKIAMLIDICNMNHRTPNLERLIILIDDILMSFKCTKLNILQQSSIYQDIITIVVILTIF